MSNEKKRWRRAIRNQLTHSSLSLSADMTLREYSEVLYNFTRNIDLKVEDIDRTIINLAESIIAKFPMQEHEKTLLRYTATLLLEHVTGKISKPIENLYVNCGHCGAPTCLSKSGTNFICEICFARSTANDAGLPIGIPVQDDIRNERTRLHEQLDRLWNTKSERAFLYNKLAKALDIPVGKAHIGNICSMQEAESWDKAIKSLEVCHG